MRDAFPLFLLLLVSLAALFWRTALRLGRLFLLCLLGDDLLGLRGLGRLVLLLRIEQEAQAALRRRLRERADAAVEPEKVTVEDDGADAGRLRGFRQLLPHRLGRLAIAAVLQ